MTDRNKIFISSREIPIDDSKKITFPGERVLQSRKKNLANGIPVLKKVWDEIIKL